MNFRIISALALALTVVTFPQAGSAQAGEAPYNWTTVPFGGGGYVPAYIYHPKVPNILYARTDVGGLYRFDFAAQKWIPLLDYLPHDDGDLKGVLSVALDPNDPQKVYMAGGMYLGQWSRKGAILRSNDQGKTWEKTELPIHVGGNSDGRGSGERLVVDPHNGQVLYFGSNQDGLWVSKNGGADFSKVGSPVTDFSLVAIDPKSNDIFLGSADGDGALYVSHDGGQSYAVVAETPRQIPQHVAFGHDGAVYVTFIGTDSKSVPNPSNADRGSVWKRDAAGKWSDITPDRPNKNLHFGYSAVDVGPDGTLAVSILDRWDGGNSIYLSKDGGAHWVGLKGNSHHNADNYPWAKSWAGDLENIGGWLSDVKINPFNPNEMVTTGNWFTENLTDIFKGKTVDFGLKQTDLEESCAMQLVSPLRGPIKVMVAFGDNAGAAWYDITKTPDEGLFRPAHGTDRSVDYAAGRPSFIVRTSDEKPYALYSEDGARSWKPFPSVPYKPASDWNNWHSPGVIAVSGNATSLVWVPEKEPAYYSTDMGKTWKQSAGWPVSGSSRQLYVISDKAADGVFYVFDGTGTIYISIDGGAHFQPVIDGLPKLNTWEQAQLSVVPGRFRDLWLIAQDGLLHSPDNNSPMTKIKAVTTAWSVGFGAPLKAGDYPAIYLWGKVKGQEGIWRSDDEGQSWVRINDGAHQFGGQIAGDMREPGVVYMAPGARGVMVGRPGN